MLARYLVVGAGGIGGIIAGCLAETGHDVTVSTTNPEIKRALDQHGCRITGQAHAKQPCVVLGTPVGESFDYILLATQPPQVEEAARSVRDNLRDNGRMICLQNGLCETRIAKIVGQERVLGAVVAWGASMLEPGHYEKTAEGGFTVGRLDGSRDERAEELILALESVGPTEFTPNLAGKRWSKLAINCAISSLGTIGGDRLGVLMQLRTVRRLALEIMTETVHVAKEENVSLEKVSGTLDLDWMALTDEERKAAGSPGLLAKHALLLAVGFRYRKMRSSMLSAIERGRSPAVDFLNGEVVSRGTAHGVDTPVNRTVQEFVWQIAKGNRTPSVDSIQALYDTTRPLVSGSE